MRYLRACFPNDQASPPPLSSNLLIRRSFRIVNPRLLILLDAGQTLGEKFIRFALAEDLPVVLLNIGSVEEVNPVLIELARRDGSSIHFFVQSAPGGQELQDAGIPSQQITIAGALDLEPGRPSQRVPRAEVRSLLGLDNTTPLIVAGPVPADEENSLLDAFRRVREYAPSTRLVLEPIGWNNGATILERARELGWRAVRRAAPTQSRGVAPWDLLIAELPGELPALFCAADVAIAAGTFSNPSDPGSLATALGAGCAVVAGNEHTKQKLGLGTAGESVRLLTTDHPALATALRRALAMRVPDGAKLRIHECQEPHIGAADRTARVIKPFLPAPTDPGPEGPTWRVPTSRDKVSDGPVWGAIAPWFMKRRIDDWETLRERLRRPQSVLCLGNGPSSEDPQVAGVEHDCLLRVNWRWRGSNFLARPDLVFVGDFATVQKLSSSLFGVWNEFLEQRLLLRRLTRRGPRRIEYITMTRLPGLVRARRWTMRPSNGALMIVAAAALRPERITVGGMDLFTHPTGRYPNDIRTRNEYARVHTRENELAMIDAALRDFPGEVNILSDILRNALDEYRENQSTQTASVASVMP